MTFHDTLTQNPALVDELLESLDYLLRNHLWYRDEEKKDIRALVLTWAARVEGEKP